MILISQPLTPSRFAPFGDVLAADSAGKSISANQGTAQMVGRLTSVANLRPDTATQNWKIYRCSQCVTRPVPLTLLEKHPYSSQLFAPLGGSGRYLAVVAHGDDAPDLMTISVFVATPQQAITYHPGVWHAPMIVIDGECDMLSLVYEDGSAHDCVLFPLSEALPVQID